MPLIFLQFLVKKTHYRTTLIRLKAFILVMLHLNRYTASDDVSENVNEICLKFVKVNKMSKWEEGSLYHIRG